MIKRLTENPTFSLFNNYEIIRKLKNKVNEIIDTFNSYAPSGSLPEVTAEDNGDVLTVVEGAWDKAKASGSNDFVVTYTEGEDDTITADKTFAEIQAAYQAGKNIKAVSDGALFFCAFVFESEIGFISTSISGGTDLSVEQILHQFNNKITRSDYNSNPN